VSIQINKITEDYREGACCKHCLHFDSDRDVCRIFESDVDPTYICDEFDLP